MIKVDLAKIILINLLKKLKNSKIKIIKLMKELKLKMVVNNITIKSNNQLMMLN